MLCVFLDLLRARGIISITSGTERSKLLRPEKKLACLTQNTHYSSSCFTTPHLFGRRLRPKYLRFRVWTSTSTTRAKATSGENEGNGDKDMQELLVDLLRLETGKVRVNEFVEDRSKFLTEIAEQASEEFDRIAEEAKKTMDEAGSKVLEQIDAEAAGFEEELAVARAEMEASERDLEQFEKNVEQARSEGLFFKSLFAKPTKPWKSRSPEEQQEIKENAKVVKQELYQETKKAAASKFRRSAYGVMIFLLTLTILEAISSENVQWAKLSVFVLLLVALVVQLTYETMVSASMKENEKK